MTATHGETRVCVLALVLSAFCMVAPPPQQDSDFLLTGGPIEARELRTESTGFQLRIDRSDGSNCATHCSLTRAGQWLWGREFAWTFDAAGLTSDGTVVGYSNACGLHIVTIDATGRLLKEHFFAENDWPLHSSRFPRALGPVVIQQPSGVAWIQVLPEASSSSSGTLDPWMVIRLADGEFLDDIVVDFPITPLEGQHLHLRDARAVGDSGLTLLDWRVSDTRRVDFPWTKYGSLFSLVDSKGATVWRLSLSGDHSDARSAILNDVVSDELYFREMICSAGPGPRFSLRHAREGLCVEYTVDKDQSAASGWRVTERGSSPFRGDVPWEDVPTTGPLSRTSTIELALPHEQPTVDRNRSVVTIDRRGRILVSDAETGTIVAFDLRGTPIARGVDLRDGLVEDSSARELESIERSGGGIPLDCIVARALLPNGDRVVLRTRLGPTLYPGLHVFHADGKPSSIILLPVGPDYDWISTSARWIAVGGAGSKLALANVDDRTVRVCDPGLGSLREWRCGLLPEGHALFFVHAGTLRVVSYALP